MRSDAAEGERAAGVGQTGAGGRQVTTGVSVAHVPRMTETLLKVASDIAVCIRSTRPRLTQRLDWMIAMFVWISNKGFWTEACRLPVGVTDSTGAARVGLAGVPFLHTPSDGVRALQVARQTGALGEPVGEDGTLGVGPTGGGLAGVRGQLTGLIGRVPFKLWKAEALRTSVDVAAAGVRATWVRRALVSFWYAVFKWISSHSFWTEADRVAIIDFTERIETTRIWITWILWCSAA